ncbi:hypothetical protein SOVF_182110 [Spinacia oleracea]|nr:hypothetical protein SOVF_182110 [Spinacia oleracea]
MRASGSLPTRLLPWAFPAPDIMETAASGVVLSVSFVRGSELAVGEKVVGAVAAVFFF